LYRFLALANCDNSKGNAEILRGLFVAYWLACMFLVVDIGLWLPEIVVN
jgi:hypothetical protein